MPLPVAEVGARRLRAEDGIRILCFEAIADIDTTGDDALRQLHGELLAAGIVLLLARVNGAVRDFMRRDGVLAVVGEERVFARIQDAVAAARAVCAAGGPR